MIAFIPAFHQITRLANPALAEATERTPVVVVADPADCSLQFDPVGKAAFTSSCDVAKSVLANAGISYSNQAAPAGAVALVRIGSVATASRSGAGLDAAGVKAVKAEVESALKAALGNMYFGLWYPVAATALSFVLCVLLIPETRGRDLDA